MKPKKILFVITKATFGGAQKYLYDLVTHLPDDQYDPVVAYGIQGRLAENLQDSGIEVRRLSALGRDVALLSDIRSFFQILRCIRRERPDIVHLNSSKAAAIGALAARLSGIKKIIFTVHGWPFKEERGVFATWFIYVFSWLSALLSTHVIVVSKVDEGLGKRMPFCARKIVYIPLGLEMPPFLSRADAAAALKADSSLPRIVTNAELTRNKGIRYALEAIAALKKEGVDVSYTIISDGEERRSLETLAETLGISSQVRFLGFVPQAARYLKAFDVFLLPSVKEGMPYVLLEAAAANLPIVTTNVVDPAFLGSYQNVRAVPAGDAEALAAAILETLKTQQEKSLFTSNGNNSFAQMLSRTEALY